MFLKLVVLVPDSDFDTQLSMAEDALEEIDISARFVAGGMYTNEPVKKVSLITEEEKADAVVIWNPKKEGEHRVEWFVKKEIWNGYNWQKAEWNGGIRKAVLLSQNVVGDYHCDDIFDNWVAVTLEWHE